MGRQLGGGWGGHDGALLAFFAAKYPLIYCTSGASPRSGDSCLSPIPTPDHGGNGVAVCSEFLVWKVPLSLLAYLLAMPPFSLGVLASYH